MSEDERAIREVVAKWFAASRAGDVDTVLGLMADDALFLAPGREPFGKEGFAAAARGMAGMAMDGTGDIREIAIHGAWAYIRTHIEVMLTPPGGAPTRQAGWTLTIFRKEGGRWLLARDANLVTPAAQS